MGVQAALVASPRTFEPRVLARARGSVWAIVLPASLGGTIALLAVAPGVASLYAWVALIAVPMLGVVALRGVPAGGSRGAARAWVLAAAGAATMLAVAVKVPGLPGQAAAVALTALSSTAIAGFLGDLAPTAMLKVGIVVMAALDAVLVFGHLLEAPNNTLNAASTSAGLPHLQVAVFGSALVGYGDLFVAAVFGVILHQEAGRRRAVGLAFATFVCSIVFDLLFLIVDVLPATVPVAIVVLIHEAVRGRVTPPRLSDGEEVLCKGVYRP
ncbi:MAG: hypothetical protein JWR52_2641 [Marmoricola sp.]|nr:hypothetical protein [Marmoricola sp.]